MRIINTTSAGHRLSAGHRPMSLQEFADLKVQTIINLQAGWFEFLHNSMYQLDEWAELTIYEPRIIHMPWSDFTAPKDWQKAHFLKAVRLGLERGSVYFCCLHGKDRTGIAQAHYRMNMQNWSRDATISEMYKNGFHRFPYQNWVNSL